MNTSNQVPFRHFGTLLDMSRNAVMNVASVKRWIDLTADMGYNTLMLYTEDTFQVDDNPYFGYMRCRYSKQELKELDAYAAQKGMELIPCTQMLAHQTVNVRWPEYKDHVDTDDILLVGDERVYALIDKMFSTMAECFTSRLINVGMDEAHMIGRGRYYDQHGDTNRFDILLEHLNRVAEIGAKYGFHLLMWSDMFFHLAVGEYYAKDVQIDASVAAKIPGNVTLIYWDYYSQDSARYDRMIAAHEQLCGNVWYAGGLWTWNGYAAHNGYSVKATKAALQPCLSRGVQDVFLTMWGDNGGDCSRFALLPSLFCASEFAKGNMDMALIKHRFQQKYGISYDRFMLLDLTGTRGARDDRVVNPDKYLLFNDCLTGLMDSTLSGDEAQEYAACARRLQSLKSNPDWGWLFESAWALCKALSLKADIGQRTRQVYLSRDDAALAELIQRYKALEKALDVFYYAYRRQWYIENKASGFDVQDLRLGGLARRVRHAREQLEALCRGDISAIDELEQAQLDFTGNGGEFRREVISFNEWRRIASANVI